MLLGLVITFLLLVLRARHNSFHTPLTIHQTIHPLEPILTAMIIGILINNIFTLPNRCYAGIIFSQKKILNIAIVLLGYQMSYASISTISNYTLLLIGLLPPIILITGIVIGKKCYYLPRPVA